MIRVRENIVRKDQTQKSQIGQTSMQSSGLGTLFPSKGFQKALNTGSQNVLKCPVINTT